MRKERNLKRDLRRDRCEPVIEMGSDVFIQPINILIRTFQRSLSS